MTTTEVLGRSTRREFSEREIASGRAPRQLVTAPSWFAQLPGPPIDRIGVSPNDSNLVGQFETQPIGSRIMISGYLVDGAGHAVPGALIELWQVNSAGRYRDAADPGFFTLDPNFTGIGRYLTGEDGRFSFRTVKPGPYTGPRSGRYRPAHIHFSVTGPTLGTRLITQCYFKDDPLIEHDPVMVSTPDRHRLENLLARFDFEGTERGSPTSAIAYEWNIVFEHAVAGLETPVVQNVDPKHSVSPSQTVGPLYGFALLFEGSACSVDQNHPDAVKIRGQLIDGAGNPVRFPEAMIEFSLGDQLARTRTDTNGEYVATIAKPKEMPHVAGRAQAPHMNVSVFMNNVGRHLPTRLYFPDEEATNAKDPLLLEIPEDRRSTLIGRPEDGELRFNLHLQGDQETVFFAL